MRICEYDSYVLFWYLLGPAQTSNLSCVESNTYLGRLKLDFDSDVELNVSN